MNRRRSERVNANGVSHINYDAKYHPMDDRLRPAQAQKRKRVHIDATDNDNFDQTPEREAPEPLRDAEDATSVGRPPTPGPIGHRRTSRPGLATPAIYDEQVHPQDSQLEQAGVIKQRSQQPPHSRSLKSQQIDVVSDHKDDDKVPSSQQRPRHGILTPSSASVANRPAPEPHKSSKPRRIVPSFEELLSATKALRHTDFELKIEREAMLYKQAWEDLAKPRLTEMALRAKDYVEAWNSLARDSTSSSAVSPYGQDIAPHVTARHDGNNDGQSSVASSSAEHELADKYQSESVHDGHQDSGPIIYTDEDDDESDDGHSKISSHRTASMVRLSQEGHDEVRHVSSVDAQEQSYETQASGQGDDDDPTPDAADKQAQSALVGAIVDQARQTDEMHKTFIDQTESYGPPFSPPKHKFPYGSMGRCLEEALEGRTSSCQRSTHAPSSHKPNEHPTPTVNHSRWYIATATHSVPRDTTPNNTLLDTAAAAFAATTSARPGRNASNGSHRPNSARSEPRSLTTVGRPSSAHSDIDRHFNEEFHAGVETGFASSPPSSGAYYGYGRL